ncbi:hypothetical protein [Merismopedia glauca]|uniref:Uncharacterized protein n=1 Tax=Merismopedia glauca CCAP 1448/3 TaxID=1296344 RepID=A0A2T1C888_9CYAN|nr:hypothetical protein [Merismopedia glauca]PSB04454.1 hypothetical protein C7B64_03965 [Merismopedia glauca CCAP 1448/3]
MAKLPDLTIATVLRLQQQLLESINETTEAEFLLFEQFGETDETNDYFDQLQNSKERAESYYLRLFTVLREIYRSQPMASRDNLKLLDRYINEAEATIDAIAATVSEIRRDFHLP